MGRELASNSDQPDNDATLQHQRPHLSPYISSTQKGKEEKHVTQKRTVPPLLPQAISPQRGSLKRGKLFISTWTCTLLLKCDVK